MNFIRVQLECPIIGTFVKHLPVSLRNQFPRLFSFRTRNNSLLYYFNMLLRNALRCICFAKTFAAAKLHKKNDTRKKKCHFYVFRYILICDIGGRGQRGKGRLTAYRDAKRDYPSAAYTDYLSFGNQAP